MNAAHGLDRLRKDVLSGRLTRREALKRAVALGLSAPVIASLLAACGNGGGGTAVTTPARTAAAGGQPTATTAATTVPVTTSPTAVASASPTMAGNASPTATGAETGQRGGSGLLRLLYWQAPTILNPHLANGTKDYHASRVALEPLIDFDSALNPIFVLATEYPSIENGLLAADGTSVTWKLRQGVKWHDGEDFNAEDVVFTWKFATNPDTPATTSGTYKVIDSIDMVDNYTVKLNFKAPNPYWYDPFTGSGGVILPEHVFRDYVGTNAANAPANLNPIGTGPFKVKEFRPGDVINYVLFEDYWDPGKPHIDQIELKGGGDAASAARQVLQTGEADWAWNLQIEPQILNDIASGGMGDVATLSGGGTERLMIQQADPRQEVDGAFAEPSTKHPIFSNVDARRAIALACQRDVIAEQLYGPGGVATANQYDEPKKFVNPDITWEYNLDKAKQLLSSIPQAQGFQLLYQTSINSVRQKTQEILKQSLEQLGFKVELKSVDAGVYFTTDPGNPDTAGKFYADLEMHTNAPGAYPSVWAERYRTDEIAQKSNSWSKSNYFRYSNPKFDTLHDQSRIELNEQKQIDLFRQMMQIVTVDDVVEVPLVSRNSVAAKGKKIQGYVGSVWASTPVYELKEWTLKQG